MVQYPSPTKPDKLMRLELCSFCTFRCQFCCWENNDVTAGFLRLPVGGARILSEALVQTGCYNINITGGEPLLLPREYLCAVIREIRATPGVRQLWITTNGRALTDWNLCQSLRAAGLTDLAVSIAAETDEKYMRYTNTHTTLSDILRGIQTAEECGLRVRVHVPLNPAGIASYEELSVLLGRLDETRVSAASYFRLHNSDKIAGQYEELFVDPRRVTLGFAANPTWRFESSGRPYYTNGKIKVFVPRDRIYLVTANCKAQRCGTFCQGIYSAYLVPVGRSWVLRACHRVYADRRNEYPLENRLLEMKCEELSQLLRTIWRYAYEE